MTVVPPELDAELAAAIAVIRLRAEAALLARLNAGSGFARSEEHTV